MSPLVSARRFALVATLLIPASARTERPAGACIDVGVDFTPASSLQIVVWVEDAAGNYVDTIYVTHKIGRFGMGNRPGRFDFNTGSPEGDTWPYGRRIMTFPVWAHRHGKTFPQLVFQNGDDGNLSHPFAQSSPELPPPYCRPIRPIEPEFDAGTCASAAYTDKGMFSTTESSRYPPRSDITRRTDIDSADVDLFRMYNPFDAVSQATPAGGIGKLVSWAAPQQIDYGDYVVWVEVSKTYDMNATYNETTYPSPTGIPWADYGKPWRGQPSVVYKVPFTLATTPMRATTAAYAGYGDPDGSDGALNAPDDTITTDTPGSGASRLQLVSDGGEIYRVRVRATPELDEVPPDVVDAMRVIDVGTSGATLEFVAPGDDGAIGTVTGYEIRIRASSKMTAENFLDSQPIAATVVPDAAGAVQMVELTGLLPDTEYDIGIRAYDNCFNLGTLAVRSFTTPSREAPEVEWCFVATAAYGSVMASDVEMLRRFRDSLLRSTVFGELAIAAYYTFSPPVARFVGASELLRGTARAVLTPIVTWVRDLAL